MIRPVMTGLVSLSLLVTAATTATAQRNQRNDTQQNRSTQIGQQRNSEQQTGQQRTELPESLQQLDLNEQQREQILAIYNDGDTQAREIWNQVQELHRQAISMEAAVIAAARLEGHDHAAHTAQSDQQSSSDQQSNSNRTQPADTSRPDQTSDDDENVASRDGASTRTALKPSADSGDRSEEARSQKNANDQAGNSRDSRSGDQTDRSESSQASRWNGLSGDMNVVALRVAVAQPNGRVREYFLTQPVSQDENNETCQMCQAHQNQLMQVWKQIHEGHEQLVELEASTIVQVEAQLTEQQLQQLDRAMAQSSGSQQRGNSQSSNQEGSQSRSNNQDNNQNNQNDNSRQ